MFEFVSVTKVDDENSKKLSVNQVRDLKSQYDYVLAYTNLGHNSYLSNNDSFVQWSNFYSLTR